MTQGEWKLNITPQGDLYRNVVVNNSFTRSDARPITLPPIPWISNEPLVDRPTDIPLPIHDEYSRLDEVVYQDATILECLEETIDERTGLTYNDEFLISSILNH